jgi:DNA helicase II / ATP-dependent DNA helicase PcrA
MFEALGTQVPPIRNLPDKQVWTEAMNVLLALREKGTVGEILTHLRTVARPRLPDKVAELEVELRNYKPENADDEMPRKLSEVEALHDVPYSEIRALRIYSLGFSPFETKHGVKGAEFENVLVVISRGWNRYNFNEMLELASARSMPEKRREAFDRNRNLFYVACSRPKSRLTLLFTQELSDEALGTLKHWFEADTIESVVF